ncbi:exopolysaccharide biosynthesis protein [Proteobacteria bacterium 005FR1]|nr:exopolysaccharide biosynthesis protein [Proteobacteria bacterium 005FR1]
MHNLEEMLDRLKQRTEMGDRVSVGAMLDAVGRRSFGPVLLFAGLIPASPLSGIPGLPSTMAVIVLLVVGQMLTGHEHFWLPQWLLRRRVSRKSFCKALNFMRQPARWVDKLLYPRLCVLTTGPAVYVIAFLCGLIALSMPPLELIPFANTTTGIAISVFGLALISRDGLLVILGLVAFTGSVYLGISALAGGG